MLKLNLLQKAFLMLENRRECIKARGLFDPRTDGMTYSEGRGRYEWYTEKIMDTLSAVERTRGDMQLIWARHASALLHSRDRYKAYAYRGGS